MSVQTTVLRDGEWVTETVGIHTVLKSLAPKPTKKPKSNKAPTCGLLTRTVVETELVHFILPVRLRSPHRNDVAFVGDHFVQIRELQTDGQLQDILRKNDFGSRIRHAAVIGSMPDIRTDEKDDKDEGAPGFRIKSEDGDVLMDINDDSSADTTLGSAALPPQMLVLVLDCGDTVFLYIRSRPDGTVEFEHSRFVSPTAQLVRPGFHLAVDPSSRYMALGCAERSFVVYELDSLKSLEEQSRRGESLTPVVSYRLRSVQGVIHQVQFLYPRPGDDHHVILLLIIVRNGKSRMATYEWELGDNLKDVFAEEKRGHRMPTENQMPLLLIPLKVRSAFIAISEEQIAVCTETLHGPPNFETFTIEEGRPPTDNFHGRNKPLWTAWARPFRLSEYFRTNDCIYLAREDGVVYFIEADSESTLTGSLYMDKFDCSISTAFSCLYDQYSDVLVMGGDSGPGAIWKVPARQSLVQLGTLPNWSPVVDFATTDEFSTWNQETGAAGAQMVPWQDKKASKPDRIFSTSGRGAKGTVTEYRYGLQAKIGLEYECGLGVRQAFVLPASVSSQSEGYDLLLSMPDRTIVLRLSEDLDDISQPPADDDGIEKYDVSSRTLTAVVTNGMIVQVTEQTIVLINAAQVFRLLTDKLGGFEPVTIIDAVVCGEYIAISTHSKTGFRLHVLRIEYATSLHLTILKYYELDAEVTCVALCRLAENIVELQAGLWQQGQPLLGRARIGGGPIPTDDTLTILNPQDFFDGSGLESASTSLEAMDSIASCVRNRELYTVMGFRSGELLTVLLTKDGIIQHGERLGGTAAKVMTASETGAEPMVLVSSDSELTLMTDFGSHVTDGAGIAKTKHRVWPVDVSNLKATSPAVDSLTVLPRNLMAERDGAISLLLISGPKILFTELQLQPGPAHRHIPVDGTPTKILYSHHLKCLIVAVIRRDKPTLMFLDPDTGEDLGIAVDKDDNIYEHARGLGKPNDKIQGLAEWEYKKGNHVWHFLIVGMDHGRLMVMSAEKEKAAPEGRQPRIRYWVRFQRKGLDRPVYSVLGHEDKLIYCVGTTIQWEVIDSAEKKLRHVGQYELESPATSLMVVDGKLIALTYRHSVEIIERMSGDGGGSDHAQLVHSDPRHRNTFHMIEVAGSPGREPASSLILVCDWNCGVGGLWVPWQSPGKDCEVVFEAELPASIRRFARGRTRPLWEQGARKPQYGRIAMTVDDAEILGVCMDGSLLHFQLLNMEVWRLLRFILNLAVTDEIISPFTQLFQDEIENFDPEPVVRPDLMHIDGDILQRCVQKRALERLMSLPRHMSRFRELLDDMEDGRLTDEIAGVTGEEEVAGYFELAYRILQHFIAPVL
ncbi:thermotolerance protein [Coniochaeta sp. PMI_546]|nr:thermotolerance protein [Coniochaeta sp. PMI_546]